MEVAREKSTGSNETKLRSSFFSKKGPSKPFFFQPKVARAETDDVHKHKADNGSNPVLIQPKCVACEEEEKLQRKKNGEGDQQPEAQALVGDALSSPRTPLDTTTSAFMQGRFGCDFGGVKIHTGAAAAKSAEAINALAYTSGDSVVFGSGQYQPTTSNGRRLLAHELTHVLQQRSVIDPKIQREEAVSDYSTGGMIFSPPFQTDVFADTTTGNQSSGNNYWYQKIKTAYELDIYALDGVTTDGMNMLFAKAW